MEKTNALTERIIYLLKQKNAILVAHYYVDSALQDLAEQTGGFVGDSLEMARFGKNSIAEIIIVAGVRFMGETAKIISPNKTVLVLDMEATCSLDEGCDAKEFEKFCKENSSREIVVYANTSAKIKALADWMVTSGSAVDVIKNLHKKGKKILWAPDKHLGNYVQGQTGADMLLWQGSCVVHENFKVESLIALKKQKPAAKVLVHPESPQSIIEQADMVGSTTAIIEAVRGQSGEFIVATDNGIFHKMRKVAPNAIIIEAPTRGDGADCESCAHCEWMAKNTIEKLLNCLENSTGEIKIEAKIIQKAQNSINKLLYYTRK